MNQKIEDENQEDETVIIDGEGSEDASKSADDQEGQNTEDEGESDEVIVSIGEEAPPPE
jgi:hypothetical protein